MKQAQDTTGQPCAYCGRVNGVKKPTPSPSQSSIPINHHEKSFLMEMMAARNEHKILMAKSQAKFKFQSND